MHFSIATTFFALASLAVHGSSALAVPKEAQSSNTFLFSRAPHFFQIREPSPDYTLYSPHPATTGASSSFNFRALDGEQSSEYHVKVYLESSSGSKNELANIPFDGYVASKNISVPFDKFPDGSYTLVAEEFSNDDGKFAGKLTQTFYIRQQNATSLKQS